jgi:hypothetical protein
MFRRTNSTHLRDSCREVDRLLFLDAAIDRSDLAIDLAELRQQRRGMSHEARKSKQAHLGVWEALSSQSRDHQYEDWHGLERGVTQRDPMSPFAEGLPNPNTGTQRRTALC